MRDEEILRPDDAIGWDVGGGAAAPGARVAANRVINGDRDVVGPGCAVARIGHQVEECTRGFRARRQLTRRRVARDAQGDLRQRRDHAVEVAPHGSFHPCRGGGIGRPQPPPLDSQAGHGSQSGRHEAGHQQPAPADRA